MSKPRFIIILVDALGWELARESSGLLELLPHHRPLDTVLGFSSAALPTLLTGRMPSEHGHWLMYRRARGPTVFAGFQLLGLLPGRLQRSYRVGRWLHRYVEARGVRGYFQLYQVPRSLLAGFDLCQRQDIFRAGAFPAGSLWESLTQNGVGCRVWDWRTPEEQSFAALRAALAGGEESVFFCYTAELDAALHREGSGGPGVRTHLGRYRGLVEQLGREDGARHWVYLLSDHGMVDVSATVDVMGRLARLPWRWPRDYLAFFDSTFARFWWKKEGVRSSIREALSELGRGHWMTDEELERHGALFPGRDYGEDLFLLDPGCLMVPSFMGSSALRGMHGYAPDHPQMRASLLSNRPVPEAVKHIRHLRAFLESELAAFRDSA